MRGLLWVVALGGAGPVSAETAAGSEAPGATGEAPLAADALADDPDTLAAQLRAAFAADDFPRVQAALDRLLAHPELQPRTRVWALRMRVLSLQAPEKACARVPALDAYLQAARADPLEVERLGRYTRQRDASVAECAASRRPAPEPAAPPPPPPPPPKGRGTLVVGAGALMIEEARPGATASLVAAEASLGYAWTSGFQLDGAVLASVEAAVLRAGLRVDLFEVAPDGPLQLRLAGQVMGGISDGFRIGGGLLAGLGLLVPIIEDFGLLTAVEGSLWPMGLHFAVDGRLGVFYAF